MGPATAISREVVVTERYAPDCLKELVRQLKGERQTGALTLHFSGGQVAAVEWRQPQQKSRDNKPVTGDSP